MSRFVTIHSDGTGHGTVLLDEDGKQVANVTEVSFSIEANGIARGDIEVRGIRTNVSGVAIDEVRFACPLCGDISEHQCDQTLGGSTQPLAPGGVVSAWPGQVIPAQSMSIARIFEYTPCWEEMVERTLRQPDKKYNCYVNSLIHHDVHIDTQHGVRWAARDGTLKTTGLGPL